MNPAKTTVNEDIVVEYFTTAGGTEKTFYTHGHGIDEPLALERNGSYFYYHQDGLGSITHITNAAKSVVQSYTYDAYGMVTPSTDFRNSYQHTGREYDWETGTLYMRERTRDLMDGNFVSKDPIAFQAGDINLYRYVQGNPVNFIDPTGLASFDAEQFSNDVQENRFDLSATLGTLTTTLGVGTMPKIASELRGLGVPKGSLNPYTSQLSRWSGRVGTRILREAGRSAVGVAVGAVATGAVVFEGFYDWAVIVRAAVKATKFTNSNCK